MYVVAVTFSLRADAAGDFLTAVQENARLSVETEPGCHRFDVAVGEDGPTTVFLYELYTDRAAFDAHLATDHFQSFDAQTAGWVADKTASFYRLT